MGRIDTHWSADVSGDCRYVQFNIAGARHRVSIDELIAWGSDVARAVDDTEGDWIVLRHRPEPENPHDPDAIAVDLWYPGARKLFWRGRKPGTHRHVGYVPAVLAKAIRSSELLLTPDRIVFILDHIWYGDDDPTVFHMAANLMTDRDDFELLQASITQRAAWSVVRGIGAIRPSGRQTFRLTRGETVAHGA